MSDCRFEYFKNKQLLEDAFDRIQAQDMTDDEDVVGREEEPEGELALPEPDLQEREPERIYFSFYFMPMKQRDEAVKEVYRMYNRLVRVIDNTECIKKRTRIMIYHYNTNQECTFPLTEEMEKHVYENDNLGLDFAIWSNWNYNAVKWLRFVNNVCKIVQPITCTIFTYNERDEFNVESSHRSSLSAVFDNPVAKEFLKKDGRSIDYTFHQLLDVALLGFRGFQYDDLYWQVGNLLGKHTNFKQLCDAVFEHYKESYSSTFTKISKAGLSKYITEPYITGDNLRESQAVIGWAYLQRPDKITILDRNDHSNEYDKFYNFLNNNPMRLRDFVIAIQKWNSVRSGLFIGWFGPVMSNPKQPNHVPSEVIIIIKQSFIGLGVDCPFNQQLNTLLDGALSDKQKQQIYDDLCRVKKKETDRFRQRFENHKK